MKIIAWDIDDTLNDLTRIWFERCWKPEHPTCPLSFEDLRANPPDSLLGCTREEYLASLDRFRAAGVANGLVPPRPTIREWFERAGHRFHHIALTATPRFFAPTAAQWLFQHFGDWFRGFFFVPSPRPGDRFPPTVPDKGTILEHLPAVEVVIDDHPGTIATAIRLGRQGVLVPQPWNNASTDLVSALERLLQ